MRSDLGNEDKKHQGEAESEQPREVPSYLGPVNHFNFLRIPSLRLTLSKIRSEQSCQSPLQAILGDTTIKRYGREEQQLQRFSCRGQELLFVFGPVLRVRYATFVVYYLSGVWY